MTRLPYDDPLGPADFEALFADEPSGADPTADLARGRSRRRRGLIARGAVAVVAVVAVGAVAGSLQSTSGLPVGPVGRASAIPSTPPAASSTPSADPTLADTAPKLTWDAREGYQDRNGRTLNGTSGTGASAFAATTKNSWTLAREHLDPGRRHLRSYEAFAFTGGGTGSGGIQVGQKLGWTVAGDAGEGMVQLAVTRLDPGASPHLGPQPVDSDGFCNDLMTETTCKKTSVDGVPVWLAATPDGGFVMDRLQSDGEIASILVSPLFGNNTDVALKEMGITPSEAVALLDDPDLDVIG